MFKSVKQKTVRDYLAAVPKDRKDAMVFLHKFISTAAPRLKSHFSYNMIGYGSFRYRNYKKEMIDWPVVALASQKNYMSIYVCAIADGLYLAERYKKDLGKVSVGKSCIRFRKLSDINLSVLKKVIKLAEKSPGLITKDN